MRSCQNPSLLGGGAGTSTSTVVQHDPGLTCGALLGLTLHGGGTDAKMQPHAVATASIVEHLPRAS